MSPSTVAPLSRVPRAVAATSSLEAATFGVLWVDHEGGIGFANKQMEALLGYTVPELIGQKISQLATFWSVTEWQSTVWQKAAAAPIASVEGTWQRKGGGSCLLDASLTRLMVAGQEFMALNFQAPTKSAAKATAQTSDYPAFLDSVPSGICFVDPSLKILQINPALAHILGADVAALVGQDIATLLTPADEVESRWHQLPSLGLTDWNVKYRNPQGHTFHLIIASRAEANDPPRFLVTVQDASERVQLKRLLDQHEHSFEHLARNTPGMIYKFTISPDGHAAFPYASPGSHDIWEVDPAEVRTDATPIIKLVHPEDLEGFQASVMKSASELSAWEYEGRMITPSGKRFFGQKAGTGKGVWQRY